jgi:hypothetical protein
MFGSLIYQKQQSITKELCDDIIFLYDNEEEKNKYHGETAVGVNKKIKDTVDFLIPENEKWKKIHKYLNDELTENLKNYKKQLNNYYLLNTEQFNLINETLLRLNPFMIQKYECKTGKYIYHNDFHIETKTQKYRVITYLWYLNTVEKGGETEFWDNYKIKPTAGTLIFFPASWLFPHRGCVPLSSDKYIITGWIYV